MSLVRQALSDIPSKYAALESASDQQANVLATRIAALEQLAREANEQTRGIEVTGNTSDSSTDTPYDEETADKLRMLTQALEDSRMNVLDLTEQILGDTDTIWTHWVDAAPLFAELYQANSVIALSSSAAVAEAAKKLRLSIESGSLENSHSTVSEFQDAARRELSG